MDVPRGRGGTQQVAGRGIHRPQNVAPSLAVLITTPASRSSCASDVCSVSSYVLGARGHLAGHSKFSVPKDCFMNKEPHNNQT
eukprot:SAG22_NODE_12_length_33707_cov_70.427118_8_plen_83_part_00